MFSIDSIKNIHFQRLSKSMSPIYFRYFYLVIRTQTITSFVNEFLIIHESSKYSIKHKPKTKSIKLKKLNFCLESPRLFGKLGTLKKNDPK